MPHHQTRIVRWRGEAPSSHIIPPLFRRQLLLMVSQIQAYSLCGEASMPDVFCPGLLSTGNFSIINAHTRFQCIKGGHNYLTRICPIWGLYQPFLKALNLFLSLLCLSINFCSWLNIQISPIYQMCTELLLCISHMLVIIYSSLDPAISDSRTSTAARSTLPRSKAKA